MFSVALSVAAPLREPRPRVLRGTLPFGVRTFLWRTLRLTSDHLPSRERYHDLKFGKGVLALKPQREQPLQRAVAAATCLTGKSDSYVSDALVAAMRSRNQLCARSNCERSFHTITTVMSRSAR